MGFISNFLGIFSSKPSDYDHLTLINFCQWIEKYSGANPFAQSSMATALFVQSAHLLIQCEGNEYTPLLAFIRNKKVSSKQIVDGLFVPFIIQIKQDDSGSDVSYSMLMDMPARSAMAFMLGSIYTSEPQMLFDFNPSDH